MADPQFSVAIPTYNRAAMIAQTMDAILAQSFPAAEIVVVDDGSKDDTEAVVKRYGEAVRYARIENSGPSVARKTAAEMSSSPWIAFCDSDDQWRRDHLARRAKLIATYPQAEFIFSSFAEFGAAAKLTDKFASMPPGWWDGLGEPDADGFQMLGEQAFVKILHANPVYPTSVTVTRALYDRVGGIWPDYSRMVSEDGDFTRRCAAQGALACDRAVTVEIRKHEENFSADKLKNYMGRIDILDASQKRKAFPAAYDDEVARAILATRIAAMREAFHAREWSAFRTLARQTGFFSRPRDLQARSLIAALPAPARDAAIKALASGE